MFIFCIFLSLFNKQDKGSDRMSLIDQPYRTFSNDYFSAGRQDAVEVTRPIIYPLGLSIEEQITQWVHQIYFCSKRFSELSSQIRTDIRLDSNKLDIACSVLYTIIRTKAKQICAKNRILLFQAYTKLIKKKQSNCDLKDSSDSWNVNFSEHCDVSSEHQNKPNLNKVYGPIANMICSYHNAMLNSNKQIYELWKALYSCSSVKDLDFKTLQNSLNQFILQELMMKYPSYCEMIPKKIMPTLSYDKKRQFIFKEMWGFQKRKAIVQFVVGGAGLSSQDVQKSSNPQNVNNKSRLQSKEQFIPNTTTIKTKDIDYQKLRESVFSIAKPISQTVKFVSQRCFQLQQQKSENQRDKLPVKIGHSLNKDQTKVGQKDKINGVFSSDDSQTKPQPQPQPQNRFKDQQIKQDQSQETNIRFWEQILRMNSQQIDKYAEQNDKKRQQIYKKQYEQYYLKKVNNLQDVHYLQQQGSKEHVKEHILSVSDILKQSKNTKNQLLHQLSMRLVQNNGYNFVKGSQEVIHSLISKQQQEDEDDKRWLQQQYEYREFAEKFFNPQKAPDQSKDQKAVKQSDYKAEELPQAQGQRSMKYSKYAPQKRVAQILQKMKTATKTTTTSIKPITSLHNHHQQQQHHILSKKDAQLLLHFQENPSLPEQALAMYYQQQFKNNDDDDQEEYDEQSEQVNQIFYENDIVEQLIDDEASLRELENIEMLAQQQLQQQQQHTISSLSKIEQDQQQQKSAKAQKLKYQKIQNMHKQRQIQIAKEKQIIENNIHNKKSTSKQQANQQQQQQQQKLQQQLAVQQSIRQIKEFNKRLTQNEIYKKLLKQKEQLLKMKQLQPKQIQELNKIFDKIDMCTGVLGGSVPQTKLSYKPPPKEKLDLVRNGKDYTEAYNTYYNCKLLKQIKKNIIDIKQASMLNAVGHQDIIDQLGAMDDKDSSDMPDLVPINKKKFNFISGSGANATTDKHQKSQKFNQFGQKYSFNIQLEDEDILTKAAQLDLYNNIHGSKKMVKQFEVPPGSEFKEISRTKGHIHKKNQDRKKSGYTHASGYLETMTTAESSGKFFATSSGCQILDSRQKQFNDTAELLDKIRITKAHLDIQRMENDGMIIDEPAYELDEDFTEKKKKKKKKNKNKKKKKKNELNEQQSSAGTESQRNSVYQDIDEMQEQQRKQQQQLMMEKKKMGQYQEVGIFARQNSNPDSQEIQDLQILQSSFSEQSAADGSRAGCSKKRIPSSKEKEILLSKDEMKVYDFLQKLQIKQSNRQKCVILDDTLRNIRLKRLQFVRSSYEKGQLNINIDNDTQVKQIPQDYVNEHIQLQERSQTIQQKKNDSKSSKRNNPKSKNSKKKKK